MLSVFKTFKKEGNDISGYAKAVRYNKLQQKRKAESNKLKYPKGFDITIADVITDYSLNGEEIRKLGEMTYERKIAHATFGHMVFYRRATIERVFEREQA